MYQLTGLALQGNKFTDVGLSYLKDLKNIETLWVDLYANGKQGLLTDQGLKHLEGLTKLKELGVQQMPNITPEGIQRLQTAIPNLKSVSK
jgi:hypothetical protein